MQSLPRSSRKEAEEHQDRIKEILGEKLDKLGIFWYTVNPGKVVSFGSLYAGIFDSEKDFYDYYVTVYIPKTTMNQSHIIFQLKETIKNSDVDFYKLYVESVDDVFR